MLHSVFAVVIACLVGLCLSGPEKVEWKSLPPIPKMVPGIQTRSGEYEIPEDEWPENGVPGDVHMYPSFDERSMGVWLNVARIGFRWYRDKYVCPLIFWDDSCSLIFDGSNENKTLDSVAPAFFNFNLARAARGHCEDVVEHCWANKHDHDDCNGTSAGTRVRKFSGPWSTEIYINEGSGTGLFRGFASIAAWICDGYHGNGNVKPSLQKCVDDCGRFEDGTYHTSGHRYGIMDKCTQWGCGVYGPEKSTSYATTCDCSKGYEPKKYAGLHIAAASHVGDADDIKNFVYMATIATEGITVKSLKVVEESVNKSTNIRMNLLYQGKAGAIYQSPSYVLYNDTCRAYYYELKYTNASGKIIERYPIEGYLYTYGMACDQNWNMTGLFIDSAPSITSYGFNAMIIMLIMAILALM